MNERCKQCNGEKTVDTGAPTPWGDWYVEPCYECGGSGNENPGEGYRLIDIAKDSPKHGDEAYCRSTKSWSTFNIAHGFYPNVTYRRRIPAKPEHQFIGPNSYQIHDEELVVMASHLSNARVALWKLAKTPEEARQVAAYALQYADWREAQGETK